ncbi:MAG TPA: PleD family two-component system response regulator [Xenococcaceae cyanobacterium]|jgi:two-component system alkaline phosphatase synthesis response regulator PhoP
MSQPILIVEDSEDLSLLMKLTLESVGYKVVTANNAEEAISSVAKEQPQLILMDIMMPQTNGLTVSRSIKENVTNQSLPILLVSAIDRLKDQQLAESKADGILYKPFDLEDLLSRVATLAKGV